MLSGRDERKSANLGLQMFRDYVICSFGMLGSVDLKPFEKGKTNWITELRGNYANQLLSLQSPDNIHS